MKLRFLHAADLHLGYQQYGSPERYDDFTRAFQWVVQMALEQRVDFVLLAGDLFEKRALDPHTLFLAAHGLAELKGAGISVVAIEGNHERAYGEGYSWVEFLNRQELLYRLDFPRQDGKPSVQAWNPAERYGAYVDIAGTRVYGLSYVGMQSGRVLQQIAPLLDAPEHRAMPFRTLLLHASIERYFDKGQPLVSLNDLSVLQGRVDYVALGHVHQRYHGPSDTEVWFCNPGSLETWSADEWQDERKGCWLVEVDTDQQPRFQTRFLTYPDRRPFIRVRQVLDSCPTPADLLAHLRRAMERERPNPATVEAGHGPRRPVVEVLLTGVARFSRTEIDMQAIEETAKEVFDPLLVRIRSTLDEALMPERAEDGERLSRAALERRVLADLIRSADRYAGHADLLVQAAITLKQLALAGAGGQAMLDTLRDAVADVLPSLREDISLPEASPPQEGPPWTQQAHLWPDTSAENGE